MQSNVVKLRIVSYIFPFWKDKVEAPCLLDLMVKCLRKQSKNQVNSVIEHGHSVQTVGTAVGQTNNFFQ